MINIGDVNVWFQIVLKNKDKWCDEKIMEDADRIVESMRLKREAKKEAERIEVEKRQMIRGRIIAECNYYGRLIPSKEHMRMMIEDEINNLNIGDTLG